MKQKQEGPASGRLRILLVANYAPDRQKSMQRFAIMLADELARQHDVTVVRPRSLLGRFQIKHAGIQKWLGYVDKYLLFSFELLVRWRGADIVHICDHANAFYVRVLGNRPHLITCHDVLGLRSALGAYAENRVGWTGRKYQKLIHDALARAMRVVCVSAATAEALAKLGRVLPAHIGVVDNGIAPAFSPMRKDEAWQRLAALGISEGEEFIAHVGGNEWYKNRMGLVRIFSALRSREGGGGLTLVTVGSPWSPALRIEVHELGLHSCTRELINVSEPDLRAIYSLAQALIFPSLDEGFGWPVAEAQACGCPVFASNRGPLSSVGGGAARYFDPDKPDEAASMIISKWNEREVMRSEGLSNARRFTSERMVMGYLDEYRSLGEA